MYYFIFEQPTSRRLSETARHIEDAVVSQGIAGEIIHLNPTRSIEHTLSDAHQKGYQTVVAVGDTKLINKVAARLLRYEMVFGIVPLGDHPALYEKIGVSTWEEAVIALRQRRWQHAPLGHINNSNLFLTKATLVITAKTPLTVKTASYESSLKPHQVTVFTRTNKFNEHFVVAHCITAKEQTGGLGSLWKSLTRHGHEPIISEFSADNIILETETPINIVIDQTVIARTPAEFSILPKALRLIVKKRP